MKKKAATSKPSAAQPAMSFHCLLMGLKCLVSFQNWPFVPYLDKYTSWFFAKSRLVAETDALPQFCIIAERRGVPFAMVSVPTRWDKFQYEPQRL
jgi:hypothetical protein